ncbi:MAG: winged helix-turn-helix transcriptional regulator [Deltaproteobacteria bacterium]|nr:winged helix-turn-helix transcriptional regulator [Deltaproteobacteria bacterium]
MSHISSPYEETSQRELAKKPGVSIGLINAILKKLISRGYIRVKALNKKKLNYLLTPKATVQMAQRSYQAVLNTIHRYRELEIKIGFLISHYVDNNHRNFFIHGDGELMDIVERVMRRHFNDSAVILKERSDDPDVVVLNLTGSTLKAPGKVVNIMEYINNVNKE